jgi:hypothetical protein
MRTGKRLLILSAAVLLATLTVANAQGPGNRPDPNDPWNARGGCIYLLATGTLHATLSPGGGDPAGARGTLNYWVAVNPDDLFVEEPTTQPRLAYMTVYGFPGSDVPLPGSLAAPWSYAPCAVTWEFDDDYPGGRTLMGLESFCDAVNVHDPEPDNPQAGADAYEIFIKEEAFESYHPGRHNEHPWNRSRINTNGTWYSFQGTEDDYGEVVVTGKLCRIP